MGRASQIIKTKKKILGLVILVIFLSGVSYLLGRKTSPLNLEKSTAVSAQQASQTALGNQELNKEFEFPFGQGKDFAKLKFVIISAELQNQIIVKGQSATAAPGKAFLLLNLKITNDSKQGFQIQTRDFVRLAKNSEGTEWVAPDMHNDPVEVQALSTKYTRVGFTVDAGIYNFKLNVGEINGDKTPVELQLQ